MSLRTAGPDRLASPDPRITAALAALGLLLGTLVLQSVVQVAVVAIARVTAALSLTDPLVVVALIVTGDLVLIAVAYTYAHRSLDGLQTHRPTRRDAGWIAGALAANLLLYGCSRLLSTWLGATEPADVLSQAAAAAPWLLPVVAVLALLVVAPAEEAFYRGALQGRLRRATGPITAPIAAAVLFALPHALNYILGGANPLAPGALVALTTVFATGATMGYAYERTQNLTVPILVHGLYDASIFLAISTDLLTI